MRRSNGNALSFTATSLMDIVRDKPGIHFRGLARAAQISSMGQLRHHIDRLQRQGVIVEVEDGRYKRFFLAGNHPPDLRRTLARFSRPVPRRIGKLLLWRPMSRAELRRNLGCADSTLGYHLSRMSLHGDLVKTGSGNRCRYALADPEIVRRALLVQNEATNSAMNTAVGPGTAPRAIDGVPAAPPVRREVPLSVRNAAPMQVQPTHATVVSGHHGMADGIPRVSPWAPSTKPRNTLASQE